MRVTASSGFASYSWRQRLVNSVFSELTLDDNYVPKNKEEMETLRQRRQARQQVLHVTQHQTQSHMPMSPHGNPIHRRAYQRSSSQTQTMR